VPGSHRALPGGPGGAPGGRPSAPTGRPWTAPTTIPGGGRGLIANRRHSCPYPVLHCEGTLPHTAPDSSSMDMSVQRPLPRSPSLEGGLCASRYARKGGVHAVRLPVRACILPLPDLRVEAARHFARNLRFSACPAHTCRRGASPSAEPVLHRPPSTWARRHRVGGADGLRVRLQSRRASGANKEG